MTNFPIGDFLIRIKNAALVGQKEVSVESTKFIKAVATSLKKEGYFEEVQESKGVLLIKLAYQNKKPFLRDLKIESKPGLRRYIGVDDLEKIRGPHIYILSTPKGIVSSREAIKNRVGGEIIVKIL